MLPWLETALISRSWGWLPCSWLIHIPGLRRETVPFTDHPGSPVTSLVPSMSPGTPQTLNKMVSNKRKAEDQQGYRQEQQTWPGRQRGAKITFSLCATCGCLLQSYPCLKPQFLYGETGICSHGRVVCNLWSQSSPHLAPPSAICLFGGYPTAVWRQASPTHLAVHRSLLAKCCDSHHLTGETRNLLTEANLPEYEPRWTLWSSYVICV